MATATVISWNLQNFGTRYGINDPDAEECELLRVNLVALYVLQMQAQVLVIQEMREQGVELLGKLQAELNRLSDPEDWHYDWLPGSIAVKGADPVKALSDLAFLQPGNMEGYGVLYREGYLKAQKGAVSAGEDGTGANYLDLIYRGRPIVFHDGGNNIVIGFASTGDGPLNFIRSCCATVNITRELRSRTINTNDVLQQRPEVRRPCVIRWTSPDGRLPEWPVVVYHAPSGAKGARSPLYGTLLGFACDKLQVGSAIYTGDLNLIASGLLSSISGYASQTLGYKFQSQTSKAFTASMVHASTPGGKAWRTGTNIYTSPRDLGFSKGQCTVNIGYVVDIIKDANSSIAKLIADHTALVLGSVLKSSSRFVANPDNAGDVLEAYFAQKVPPKADYDANTCYALIYNLLFSDHLPVFLTRTY